LKKHRVAAAAASRKSWRNHMSSKSLNIIGILIILVGAFMLLSGIDMLTNNTKGLGGFQHNVSKALGGSGNTVNIIIAVLEITAGALLILSRFMSIGALDSFLRIAVFIFWIVLMVLGLILGDNIKRIDTLGWWSELVSQSIILVILWMIKE
jgi:uncharacterized membrane protein YphA (DoxX/SURF4 family)